MPFRSYLTLLLLFHYLLVVGAGLVERPAHPVERPFAYVHHHECQLRNALRIGCFDDCNGVQYTVRKTGERLPLQQLLSSLKVLDWHCLSKSRLAFAAPVFPRAEVRHGTCVVTVPTGYQGRIELPPRRG